MTHDETINELVKLIYDETNMFFKAHDLAEKIYKLGYRKVVLPHIKLKTCRCGSNRRACWYTSNGVYYVCKTCKLQSPLGKTVRQAKQNWNKMIDELEKDNDKCKHDSTRC